MTSFIEQMNQNKAHRAKIQEMLNHRLKRNGFVPKSALVFYAEHFHRQYPQYDGFWDGDEWQVEQIGYDVRTKMGQAFVTGDVVLVKRESYLIHGTTVYSLRNNANTSI